MFQKRIVAQSCMIWLQNIKCTSAAITVKERENSVQNTFITKCKFAFPRPASDKTIINNVKESMKAKKKIYHVKRDEEEVRINDYNLLILLLWKANVDIQFVSESSLAPADYVSGYVTKAEKSHLQDMWQEVSSDKTFTVDFSALVYAASVLER